MPCHLLPVTGFYLCHDIPHTVHHTHTTCLYGGICHTHTLPPPFACLYVEFWLDGVSLPPLPTPFTLPYPLGPSPTPPFLPPHLLCSLPTPTPTHPFIPQPPPPLPYRWNACCCLAPWFPCCLAFLLYCALGSWDLHILPLPYTCQFLLVCFCAFLLFHWTTHHTFTCIFLFGFFYTVPAPCPFPCLLWEFLLTSPGGWLFGTLVDPYPTLGTGHLAPFYTHGLYLPHRLLPLPPWFIPLAPHYLTPLPGYLPWDIAPTTDPTLPHGQKEGGTPPSHHPTSPLPAPFYALPDPTTFSQVLTCHLALPAPTPTPQVTTFPTPTLPPTLPPGPHCLCLPLSHCFIFCPCLTHRHCYIFVGLTLCWFPHCDLLDHFLPFPHTPTPLTHPTVVAPGDVLITLDHSPQDQHLPVRWFSPPPAPVPMLVYGSPYCPHTPPYAYPPCY